MRAAAKFGVVHMLSSVCKPGLEEVAAAAPGYPKLFQLYVRGTPDWVDERIGAAVKAGYTGIALTVDLDYYGRRERDIAKRYKPTARRANASEAAGDPHQQAFTWDDIRRIRKKFAVPLILKGIATAEDAIIAVEHGVDVVYVSNHGGRQLDHGLGGIEVLPEVVDAVRGRAKVVVDGGFMRGADIVKAMALGASAVGMGRLQGLALAAGGEAGMIRALELLETRRSACSACSASPRSRSSTGAFSPPVRRLCARRPSRHFRCCRRDTDARPEPSRVGRQRQAAGFAGGERQSAAEASADRRREAVPRRSAGDHSACLLGRHSDRRGRRVARSVRSSHGFASSSRRARLGGKQMRHAAADRIGETGRAADQLLARLVVDQRRLRHRADQEPRAT